MANLQTTYGSFVLKGVVTGLSREGAFTNGQKDGGNPWQKVQFGVKTSNTEFVYVELMGSKSKDVQFVYRDPDTKKKDNKNTKKVTWADKYKERKDNFEIQMSIKAGLERDEEGKKKKDNHTLVQYDAIEYIKKYLKDGESVFIRGQIEITDYQGKAQEKYKVQQIYVTNEAVDFDTDGFLKEASFDQEIVYVGQEDDVATGKTYIDTYIIYKKDGEMQYCPYVFAIDPNKYESDKEKKSALLKLVQSFKNQSFGTTIRVNGNINNGVILVKDTNVDPNVEDFGGFDAEGQGEYVKDKIKELEITKGNGATLQKGRYTEDDFVKETNPFNEEQMDINEEDLPF